MQTEHPVVVHLLAVSHWSNLQMQKVQMELFIHEHGTKDLGMPVGPSVGSKNQLFDKYVCNYELM